MNSIKLVNLFIDLYILIKEKIVDNNEIYKINL